MGTMEMTRYQWALAHSLAANLAVRNVSKNLLLGLHDYLTRHPGTQPDDYLDRLARLGDAFAGGEDELRQRRELQQIILDVGASDPSLDWALVLPWTVRLMLAYRPEERGPTSEEQERQIQGRIKQELDQDLKRLEEPYYG